MGGGLAGDFGGEAAGDIQEVAQLVGGRGKLEGVVVAGAAQVGPRAGGLTREFAVAVEAAAEQVPASETGDETTIAQRRADALGLVAESALAGGLDPGNSADRFQVTVHVQAGTLPSREPANEARRVSAETRAGSPAPSEPPTTAADAAPHVAAETFEVGEDAGERVAPDADLDAGLAVIEQLGRLHVSREAARRVACDAGLVVLQHGAGGEILDVGRRTRTVPSALRRALQCRDHSQYEFPGCDSRRCDAHHVLQPSVRIVR